MNGHVSTQSFANSSSNNTILKPALINRGNGASDTTSLALEAAKALHSTPEGKGMKVNFALTMTGTEFLKQGVKNHQELQK